LLKKIPQGKYLHRHSKHRPPSPGFARPVFQIKDLEGDFGFLFAVEQGDALTDEFGGETFVFFLKLHPDLRLL